MTIEQFEKEFEDNFGTLLKTLDSEFQGDSKIGLDDTLKHFIFTTYTQALKTKLVKEMGEERSDGDGFDTQAVAYNDMRHKALIAINKVFN